MSARTRSSTLPGPTTPKMVAGLPVAKWTRIGKLILALSTWAVLSTVMIVFLLLVSCASAGPAKPDRLEMRATPRFQTFKFRPAEVFVEVKIRQATEKTYCAAGAILWGDGSLSTAGDTCDPYGMPQSRALPQFWRGRHLYKQPGEYTITFVLSRDGKTIIAREDLLVYVY